MKRGIVQTIVLAFTFLILPQYMNAEESGENDGTQPNLLGNIINQQTDLVEETITDTTEVVVEVIEEGSSGTMNHTDEIIETVDTSVEQTEVFLTETVNNLDQPGEIVEQTANMVEKVTQSTKALVTHTTESTTGTIEKSTERVSQSVTKTVVNIKNTVEGTKDEVINKVLPIPVATQIINDKSSNVLEPIEPIDEPVVKTNETINNKPLHENEKRQVPTEKMDLTLNHTRVQDSVNVPSIKTSESKMEIQKLITLTESTRVVDIPKSSQNKMNKLDAQSQKAKDRTQANNNKINQMFKEPLKMMFSSSHLVNSSSHFTPINGVSDGVAGVLMLDANQIGLNKVWWNQGYKFALNQWIYEPLGQPPRFTPFLN